ncbi:hypothetical protein FNL55_13180 [Tardiphaga sp. vice352]|uniref:hypothetical protein n=1 Tax=unclassified Tardiphaga TaxID=2631404 RepID=UPI0011634AE7|nr:MULTISPECIES: hypothetical protein [unclassified Tardiphaga]QDM16843.1 hypothetical protein FNL53_13560 [Tardiphaga sp. vice278]QDM32184.1 hypothetical protein FNL55_13180 [Tardiphaga sp. vice352]
MTALDATLIPTAQLRARYGGVSHMWVERRLKDDVLFPRPVYLGKRRFWRLDDLTVWERIRAAHTIAVSA